MRLGLCCMLHTTKMKKGFVGINAFNKCENPVPKLMEASLHNLAETKKCLDWVIDNGTGMYRFSSDLIPFAELWDWQSDPRINLKLTELKRMCEENNIKTTIHPSQFCVINSENPQVIENSISILKYHEVLCDRLGIEVIILHTGISKGEYARRFVEGYSCLSNRLKALICLENCHKVDINSVIDICEQCNIRPILDLHHNRVCGNIDINSEVIERIQALWDGGVPIGHISSGKSREDDKAHADYISVEDIEKFKDLFDSFDLEIEAKKKDLAIANIILQGGIKI